MRYFLLIWRKKKPRDKINPNLSLCCSSSLVSFSIWWLSGCKTLPDVGDAGKPSCRAEGVLRQLGHGQTSFLCAAAGPAQAKSSKAQLSSSGCCGCILIFPKDSLLHETLTVSKLLGSMEASERLPPLRYLSCSTDVTCWQRYFYIKALIMSSHSHSLCVSPGCSLPAITMVSELVAHESTY